MPTLYATPLSANGRKALAVARHIGVDVRVELVNVYRGEGRTPAFLAVDPQGTIPTRRSPTSPSPA
jgi:glutathione S-transferase